MENGGERPGSGPIEGGVLSMFNDSEPNGRCFGETHQNPLDWENILDQR